MSTKEVSKNEETKSTSVADLDMKLEVVVIPVSDVDRAKEFYSRLGWRLDADRAAGENFRLVQFTPPGSGSSIQFGVNLTSVAPGSAQGMLLAVSDIEAARKQLIAHGVDASEVFHCETGTACRFPGIGVRVSGLQPEHLSYHSVSFSDPDGNGWLLRSYEAASQARYRQHDVCVGARPCPSDDSRRKGAWAARETDWASRPNWPDWDAEYMVREQSGEELAQ